MIVLFNAIRNPEQKHLNNTKQNSQLMTKKIKNKKRTRSRHMNYEERFFDVFYYSA